MYFHSLMLCDFGQLPCSLCAFVSPSVKWWQYLPYRVLVRDKWTNMWNKLNSYWCTVDFQWMLALLIVPTTIHHCHYPCLSNSARVILTVMPAFLLSVCFTLCCFWESFLIVPTQTHLTVQGGEGNLHLALRCSGWVQPRGGASPTPFNKRAEHLLHVRTRWGTGDTQMNRDGPCLPGMFYPIEKETYKQKNRDMMEVFKKYTCNTCIAKGMKRSKCLYYSHQPKKHAGISPILKKSHFDPTTFSSYHFFANPYPLPYCKAVITVLYTEWLCPPKMPWVEILTPKVY